MGYKMCSRQAWVTELLIACPKLNKKKAEDGALASNAYRLKPQWSMGVLDYGVLGLTNPFHENTRNASMCFAPVPRNTKKLSYEKMKLSGLCSKFWLYLWVEI